VVTLVGPRMRCMDQVRILGPLRSKTQVELATREHQGSSLSGLWGLSISGTVSSVQTATFTWEPPKPNVGASWTTARSESA
jgi:hypothetical protein